MKRRNKLYEVFVEASRRQMMEDAAMKLPAHAGKPTKTKEATKAHLTASGSEIEPPTFTLSRGTHTPVTFSSSGTGASTTFPWTIGTTSGTGAVTAGYYSPTYRFPFMSLEHLMRAIHTMCPDYLADHPIEEHRPWAEKFISALGKTQG